MDRYSANFLGKDVTTVMVISKLWAQRILVTGASALVAVLLVALAFASALPVDGKITQWFHSNHNGVDIAAPIGTPIKNVEDGVVTIAGGNDPGGYGWYVQVLGDSGYVHEFGHVNAFHVQEGQRVQAGDHIADVGNRGQSTGAHVHWRVIPPQGGGMDPLSYEPPRHDEPEPEPIIPPVPPTGIEHYLEQLIRQIWEEIQRHTMPVS